MQKPPLSFQSSVGGCSLLRPELQSGPYLPVFRHRYRPPQNVSSVLIRETTCRKLYTVTPLLRCDVGHPRDPQCPSVSSVVNRVSRFSHSYRRASAGRILAADHDGYSVATNDTPTATSATSTPSIKRGTNGT